MKKLERYCENLSKYNQETIKNYLKAEDNLPETTKQYGRIVNLSRLLIDTEEELIKFYENEFKNIESIKVIELKLKDMLENVKFILGVQNENI